MSLLQRTDVYPAFRPSGVMNSDVSEVTETDEDSTRATHRVWFQMTC
jgi:hypothetical protein